jgi:hypothetical protein
VASLTGSPDGVTGAPVSVIGKSLTKLCVFEHSPGITVSGGTPDGVFVVTSAPKLGKVLTGQVIQTLTGRLSGYLRKVVMWRTRGRFGIWSR